MHTFWAYFEITIHNLIERCYYFSGLLYGMLKILLDFNLYAMANLIIYNDDCPHYYPLDVCLTWNIDRPLHYSITVHVIICWLKKLLDMFRISGKSILVDDCHVRLLTYGKENSTDRFFSWRHSDSNVMRSAFRIKINDRKQAVEPCCMFIAHLFISSL